MRKALLVVFLLVVLTLISVYVFIPRKLHISEIKIIKTNTNALYRYLADQTKWTNWWPDTTKEKRLTNKNRVFKVNNYTYELSQKLYNAVDIKIIKGNQVVYGKIVIIPVAEDSLVVQWRSTLAAGANPFTRYKHYKNATEIKKSMTVILDSLKTFAENKEKVYKLNISRTTLKDTAFVATKTITTDFPSTKLVYQLIDNLKTYIAVEKARETDFPILNVTKQDSLHYQVMVAIATDKALNGKGNIVFKRMIPYKDKILTADVKGGPQEIKQAYDTLNTYMNDYNLASPVIHWETLITDRLHETDSTKWITKICIPIV